MCWQGVRVCDGADVSRVAVQAWHRGCSRSQGTGLGTQRPVGRDHCDPVLSNTSKTMGTMGPVVPLGLYVPKGVRKLPRGDGTDLRHKGTQPGRVCVCEQVCLNSRLWNRSASIGQHGSPTQREVCRPLPHAHWEVSHGLWSHMQLLAASKLMASVPQSWESDTSQ